ncbi:hypothetical protein SEA_LUCKYSOCKE_172 [Streptomyces phage LuckySocke]|nr:hypothetical protein SEA_ALONE_174 [Streptomyces phage Alone3]WPH58896.1 hypothetical protein SEA_LUCKYSOCKE_172 [Streptomyces phage LuckySocke]
MTINTELAGNIRTVIDMIPNMHDQGHWFYVYETYKDKLTPEDVHVVELLAEAKDAEEKGVSYSEFEPTVSCPATLCVAGWACIMNGYTLVEDDSECETFAEKDGVRTKVLEKGAELLGLDSDVANWLFCDTDDEAALDALDDLSAGELPSGYVDRTRESYCCDECSGY